MTHTIAIAYLTACRTVHMHIYTFSLHIACQILPANNWKGNWSGQCLLWYSHVGNWEWPDEARHTGYCVNGIVWRRPANTCVYLGD